MVEQHSDPPKRVVKKVVKRTVVREAPAPPERPARTARLDARTRPAPTRRPAPPVAPRRTRPAPAAQTATMPTPAPPQRIKEPKARKTLSRPSVPRADVRGGVADGAATVGDWFIRRWHAVIDAIADGWHGLTGLRLPVLSPMRGSVVTGLIVGFLAVGVGWGFYELFRATLGTSAGGRWGFLALVFVGFLGFITGELLLTGFGVTHARAISILAVLMVFVAIMLVFIDLAAGIWAVLIVPSLCVAAYATSCTAMLLAGSEPNAQRIPWEPTDDSTVT